METWYYLSNKGFLGNKKGSAFALEKFVKELDETIGKLLEYDKIVSKIPKDYGCGIPLSMSEIHTIEAIGNYPGANVTDLAEVRGVTKGALSKMLSRLEKAGFIRRYQYKDNKKEHYFQLTALGRKAYEGHYLFHESRSNVTHAKYKEYSEEERKLILGFLHMYVEYLKDYME